MGQRLSRHVGDVLIPDGLRIALKQVASASVLLVASDYDGVLSPIVPDPAAAVPDERALTALTRLSSLPATSAAAISGRALSTLKALTGAPDGLVLVGTHGAEETGAAIGQGLESRVDDLASDLRGLAKQHPGAEVEKKPLGAAFHYRHVTGSRQREAAQAAQHIAGQAGARAIAGKMVVECMFGDANKGAAVDRLRVRHSAAAVVFLGDDVTDEDAFAVLRDADVGVKVGEGATIATHRVPGQEHVAEVLEYLWQRRSGQSEEADSPPLGSG